MLCWFLPYNNTNPPWLHFYHLPLEPPSPPPTPCLQIITEHQAGLPELCSNISPAIHATHGSVCMSMLLSPFVPLFPSLTVSTNPFSISVSIPSLQIGSSTPFFQIPCMLTHILYPASLYNHEMPINTQFFSVQLLSRVRLFVRV